MKLLPEKDAGSILLPYQQQHILPPFDVQRSVSQHSANTAIQAV